MAIKLLSIILCVPLIVGCGATIKVFRDEEGRIVKIESKGIQDTEINSDGSIKHKTSQDLIPKNLLSISGLKS